MKQKIIFITTLLVALNCSVYAKSPGAQTPPKPKYAGHTIKTKNGANIKTKNGAIVQVKKGGFLKQPG